VFVLVVVVLVEVELIVDVLFLLPKKFSMLKLILDLNLDQYLQNLNVNLLLMVGFPLVVSLFLLQLLLQLLKKIKYLIKCVVLVELLKYDYFLYFFFFLTVFTNASNFSVLSTSPKLITSTATLFFLNVFPMKLNRLNFV